LIQVLILMVAACPVMATAQSVTWTYRPASQGWIGFFYRFSSAAVDGAQRTVVIIEDVADESPAETAGLQAGDTLTHLDGQRISQEVFLSMSQTLEPGDRVRLTVRRGGRSSEVLVEAAAPPQQVIVEPDADRIRVELESLSGNILKELDSLRLHISGVRVDRVPENLEFHVLRVPPTAGADSQYALQFQFQEPFLDSLTGYPSFGFSLEPDLTFPFQAMLVESQATSQMKEELTNLRKELTAVRREELSRRAELTTSIRGAQLEEVLRTDEKILQMRARETKLLSEQTELAQRLRQVSEEEMQKQWAEIQSRNQEVLLRARQAQAEASGRAQRDQRDMENRLRSMYVYAPGEGTSPVIMGQSFILGAQLTPLNPQLAEYFPVDRGVFVVQVVDGTPAYEAGLRGGDIIIAAGDEDVASLADLRLGVAASEGPLRIKVIRKGDPVEIIIRR